MLAGLEERPKSQILMGEETNDDSFNHHRESRDEEACPRLREYRKCDSRNLGISFSQCDSEMCRFRFIKNCESNSSAVFSNLSGIGVVKELESGSFSNSILLISQTSRNNRNSRYIILRNRHGSSVIHRPRACRPSKRIGARKGSYKVA